MKRFKELSNEEKRAGLEKLSLYSAFIAALTVMPFIWLAKPFEKVFALCNRPIEKLICK